VTIAARDGKWEMGNGKVPVLRVFSISYLKTVRDNPGFGLRVRGVALRRDRLHTFDDV